MVNYKYFLLNFKLNMETTLSNPVLQTHVPYMHMYLIM